MTKDPNTNDKGRVIANDGLPTKAPQVQSPTMKVNGGYVPKIPITTGSKKK